MRSACAQINAVMSTELSTVILPPPPRGFVFWLSIAQLISWGTLFYTFALLLEHFERDLSLSRVDTSLAFSLALLFEGVLAFLVGRMIDAGRARIVMSLGSLIAVFAFLGMAFVQTKAQLYTVWIVAGIAMSGTLYAPVFAVLIRRFPTDYRRAIITLTFLGGLASTVFIPLSAFLIAKLGWRDSLLVLAALHLFICFPIHAYWLRGDSRTLHHASQGSVAISPFLRRFPFWGLAVFLFCFLRSLQRSARTWCQCCASGPCQSCGSLRYPRRLVCCRCSVDCYCILQSAT